MRWMARKGERHGARGSECTREQHGEAGQSCVVLRAPRATTPPCYTANNTCPARHNTARHGTARLTGHHGQEGVPRPDVLRGAQLRPGAVQPAPRHNHGSVESGWRHGFAPTPRSSRESAARPKRPPCGPPHATVSSAAPEPTQPARAPPFVRDAMCRATGAPQGACAHRVARVWGGERPRRLGCAAWRPAPREADLVGIEPDLDDVVQEREDWHERHGGLRSREGNRW